MGNKRTGYLDSQRIYGDVQISGKKVLGGEQAYYQIDANQNWEIGAKMKVDRRVFCYSQAVAALATPPDNYRLAVSTDQILAVNDLLSVGVTAIGATTIVVTVGALQGGVVVADEFKNGYVEIWPLGGLGFMWRKIISNTATAVGGNITLTLDKPMDLATGAASQVTIHPSIYRHVDGAVHAALPGFAAAIGLPPVPVTINYYFWLQTYGPCFIGPTGAWPLSVANQYDVYNHQDGTTNSSLGEVIGTTPSPQRIGHVEGSGAYGSGAVFLELEGF
jgi:hypothetical protein